MSGNIIYQHTTTFRNIGNGCFGHLQNIDNQHLYFYQTLSCFTGKEKDSETGYYYFGARYYDSDLSGLFLSVDPMSDKYPHISPYAYCAWNPVKLVDPEGEDVTDFKDANGTLIKHVEDGSDALFILQNAFWDPNNNQMIDKNGRQIKPYNAFFKYSKGNPNNINIRTVVDFSQEFCMNNYTSDGNTYCNYSAGFIINSFISACEAKGFTIDVEKSFFMKQNGSIRTAGDIFSRIKPNALYEDAVRLSSEIDESHAYLSLGSFSGHIVTFIADGSNKPIGSTIVNIGGTKGNTYQNGGWLTNTKYTNGSTTKFYTIGAYQ